MEIEFYKYHGTGNDFILIDNRLGNISLTTDNISFLCHRRFGIGADGLMLLGKEHGYDFKMVYYNSDGKESSMCGNGGRCIVAFASRLGLIKTEAKFTAVDGAHQATIHGDGSISLLMADVTTIKNYEDYSVLNTGSPHYVAWKKEVADLDVYHEGKTIRHLPDYTAEGINVNFTEKKGSGLFVRTYERGVEDETLSCGTGVTAAAIALSGDETGRFTVPIETPGGNLEVSYSKDSSRSATEVILKGPAVFVFAGKVTLT
jgi:diaminopimelate epimerase